MREIKFRAWFVRMGKMLTWKEMTSEWTLDQFAHPSAYDEDMKLMQFTGLKDKNGKEIYEGDIVDYYFSENETADHCIGVIEYGSLADRAGFCIVEKRGIFFPLNIKCYLIVIGNIYENYELLKEGAK